MRNRGYSLLEMSIAITILSVVSLLGFVALRGATESASLAASKSEVQACLRDTMRALTSELQLAYTERISAGATQTLPPNLEGPIEVADDAKSLTFQAPVPVGAGLPMASTPITIRFVNEDANANGLLDAGEDTDQDGTLSRRLVRSQDGIETVVGASNLLSDVNFALVPSQDASDPLLTTLTIGLEADKTFGTPVEGHNYVRSALSGIIHLHN